MKKNAFSLVELSIVLIIIGLLVITVSAGSKLLDQGRISKVLADIREYEGAYQTFQITYEAIPGDLTVARGQEIFGNTVKKGGNGNGVIYWVVEESLAWQHLSLARLVPGQYTPITDGNQAHLIEAGVSGPKSAINGTCYAFSSYPKVWGRSSGTQYGPNAFVVGKDKTASNCSGGIMKAKDVYKIDVKADDGKPFTGRVLANESNGCGKVENQDTKDGSYRLNGEGCTLYYLIGL